MNRYKSVGLVGLAAASLFATQAFAAVPTPGPSSCGPAPVAAAGTMDGNITCVAAYGTDGLGTGLANYLNQNDASNPTGLVVSGPGINPYTDQVGPNANWTLGPGGNTSTILLEIAGNAGSNTFGIYDLSNPGNMFQLFSGTDAAGITVTLTYDGSGIYSMGALNSSLFGSGSLFGYYLGASAGIFYSDPALNSIGPVRQFVEFKGDNLTTFQTGATTTLFDSSKYLLAWEDMLATNSDQDYNDFVVLVTANPSVPEPAALGMFGLGAMMIGLFAGLRRRRENV